MELLMPYPNFWCIFYKKFLYKKFYIASIKEMRLRLPELQKGNQDAKKLKKDQPEG